MNITQLDQALKALCPIDGISIGKADDPKTWRIDFTKDATPTQIQAAEALIATVTTIEPGTSTPALDNGSKIIADILVANNLATSKQIDDAVAAAAAAAQVQPVPIGPGIPDAPADTIAPSS